MKKGLFLNTKKAKCSIYESGLMCYNALKSTSDFYSLDYEEIDETQRSITCKYDFYVFNYHFDTMGWLDTSALKKLPGFKMTIVLEVLPNNPFVYCSEAHFDAFIVLDPTMKHLSDKVYAFPRPLEDFECRTSNNKDLENPVIGTYGFATQGKGFDKVITAVDKEFKKATVRINIPFGDYVPRNDYDRMISDLKLIKTTNDINVQITSEYFEKDELVQWCSDNTLNVFLYNRNIPGLSATTDQAISSCSSLAVSSDQTFRHIHQYIIPYPFRSLKDSMLQSQEEVKIMKKIWSKEGFVKGFEEILSSRVSTAEITNVNYVLESKFENPEVQASKIQLRDFIPPILLKIKNKILHSKAPQLQEKRDTTLQPYLSHSLKSYSQFGEDLMLAIFLRNEKGFYVDIGANDPFINSNTYRLYLKGWRGVNVEPNQSAFRRLLRHRTNDINLNIAIDNRRGNLSLYTFAEDSTLSSLDLKQAEFFSQKFNYPIVEQKVEVITLEDLFQTYANDVHIDLLTIDTEGVDLDVLMSNDWEKIRPSLVMIESNINSRQIFEYMNLKDYYHVYNNEYNSLFIDKYTRDENIIRELIWKG